MSEVDSAWGGMIDKDLVKKALESNLIEAGRYRVTVDKYEDQDQSKEFFGDDEKRRNPFFGKKYGTLTLRLGSKRDGKGATAAFTTLSSPRVFFLKISPVTVMSGFDENKLSKESKHWGFIAALATRGGVTQNSDVVDWLSDQSFELVLGMYPEGGKDGRTWEAGNTVREIKALKEGE